MSCDRFEPLYLATLEENASAEVKAQWQAHVETCADCAEAAETHRQLEKGLFRLVDPLPPPSLVSRVMARVDAASSASRVEARTGLAILGVALVLSLSGLFAAHASVASFGVGAAHAVLTWRSVGIALLHALGVLRATAIVPLVLVGGSLLLASLAGLRRLAGQTLVEAETPS